MRNNIQNDVKAENSREFTSKLDLSGSISTTASMGKVNCKFMRRLLPYTKALCGEEQMVWLSPMVRPTYGKLFYKTWHYFVSCKDLWAGWPSFKTGQPVSSNGQILKFTVEPHAQVGGLALFALVGAKASLYISEVSESHPLSEGVNRTFYIQPPVNASYTALVQRILSSFYSPNTNSGRPQIDVGTLCNGPFFWDGTQAKRVPSGNVQWESFCDLEAYNMSAAQRANGFDYTNVKIDKADAKVFFVHEDESTQKIYVCCLAFRFSSWGRWYSDLLRALGYGFQLGSNEYKTLLPLVGVFDSYWNTFGLNQFQNFESTYAGRVKSWWDTHDNFDPWLSEDMWETFNSFILVELGCMWVTEQADYVAAHLPQPVIGQPAPYSGLIDVNGPSVPITIPSGNDSRRPNMPNNIERDGHAYITNVNHGALDSRLMMRLYKTTNRNTPLGRHIASLMKAAGYGFYAMYAKVNYIGETSIPLNIDKVVSQSDTFNPVTEDGAPLGDYAGRGIGYKPNDKKLYHYTEDEGFWFCLDAITCDSSYSQGVDQTLSNITRDSQFNPDYDGEGLVLHNKSLIAGSDSVCASALAAYMSSHDVIPDGSSVPEMVWKKPFGFAPIYSEYKVGRSIVNGGFAAPSERNSYLAFILDKLLYPNEVVVQQESESSTVKSYQIGLSLPIGEIPVAGTAWRYLSRFFWLSNLNRIFAYSGSLLPSVWSLFQKYAEIFEYIYRVKDNYVLVSDLWFKVWSACLPIEETWGTLDPDKKELEYFDRT